MHATILAPLTASLRPPLTDRPRERLVSLGGEALSDAELIALLLRTGGPTGDALALSRDLLDRCGGLLGVNRASRKDLATTSGIGPAKAASLLAALELGRRLAARRLEIGDTIRRPEDIHRHFFERLRDVPCERFIAVMLDGRHRIMGEVLVSQGTLTASLVHPREVFRDAVRESAAALVLVHNHPSGDPSPSVEDHRVTQRLVKAGDLIGIRILDHVVVAEHGYFSFSEAGELDDGREQLGDPG